MSDSSREKPQTRVVRWLVVGGALVLAIWLLGTLFVPAWLVASSDPSDLGAAGDRFGAVNALFSGFAFLGLIVVLVYEMRERQRDLEHRRTLRQPYIAPSLFPEADLIRDSVASGGAQLGIRLSDAARTDAGGHATLRFEIGLANLTDETALDVQVEVGVPAYQDAFAEAQVTMPIGAKETAVIVAELTMNMPGVAQFFRVLESGFEATVRVRYGGLDGEKWISEVEVSAVPDERAKSFDLSDLQQVARGALKVGRSNEDMAPMEYVCTPKPGSWRQEHEG